MQTPQKATEVKRAGLLEVVTPAKEEVKAVQDLKGKDAGKDVKGKGEWICDCSDPKPSVWSTFGQWVCPECGLMEA